MAAHAPETAHQVRTALGVLDHAQHWREVRTSRSDDTCTEMLFQKVAIACRGWWYWMRKRESLSSVE